MRHFFTAVLVLLAIVVRPQSAPIGSWADYFPYDKALGVAESSNHMVSATPYALTVFKKEDNSLDRLSKANGLSEINITALEYDATSQTFVVGYASGNIDLVHEPELTITNLSDIKRANITANKTINHVMCRNGEAFLSTGFGLVVLNLAAREVKDTYYLGPGNSYMNINGTTYGNDTIYATTDNGMYRAWASNPFLNIASSWSKDLSLPAAAVNSKLKPPFFAGNKLFVIRELPNYGEDTSYVRNGATWTLNPYFSGVDLYNVWTNGTKIVMAGATNARLFNTSFVLERDLYGYSFGGLVDIRHAIYSPQYDNFFIADFFQGTVRAFDTFNSTPMRFSGPAGIAARRIAAGNNYVWVAPGNVLGTIYLNTNNRDYISHSVNYEWSGINTNQSLINPDSLYDVLSIKVDPIDETHVFASSWSYDGLIEIRNNQVVATYDETNGVLESHPTLPGFCGVDGIDFDDDGNLWVANSYATSPLVLRKADGSWKSFNCGINMADRILGDVVCAKDLGYKYITIPTNGQGNGGLFVYNDNLTPDDASDDSYKLLDGNTGNGDLPSTDVRCVAEDLDGEIWIGTTQGLAIIYSPENIFTSGANFDAQQILITQDGNVQILLETEIITDIAIDGGNRKWIATESSGVFLFSQDGVEQIFHFTQSNSPLPTNTVNDIEINGNTGEVYFATTGGIVAYRSEATDAQRTMDDVYVFPNPVQPGYNGLVAVNGLGRDSDIKITDVSGNVVFMTKSLGGQAVWDINTLAGTRVAPGIYLVMCSNKSGKQKVAAKLLILE